MIIVTKGLSYQNDYNITRIIIASRDICVQLGALEIKEIRKIIMTR